MKHLSLILCLFLSLASQSRAADDAADVSAHVKEFYHWYVHALNANERADLLAPKHRAEIKRYVSADYLRRLDKMRKGPDGLDGDPFLDAQDWDRDWEKNIEVKDVSVTAGGHATAKVTLSGKEMTRKLELKLVSEDGVFKLSDVKGVD